MPNRNVFRTVIGIAGVLLLSLAFVSYRARTFHYCAVLGDHPSARVMGGAETCRPTEEPLEISHVGGLGKLKLAAQTAAKAFGSN